MELLIRELRGFGCS